MANFKSIVSSNTLDKNPSLAQSLHVKGVPTLMVFKNGKSVWRQSGVVQANDLVRIIQSA